MPFFHEVIYAASFDHGLIHNLYLDAARADACAMALNGSIIDRRVQRLDREWSNDALTACSLAFCHTTGALVARFDPSRQPEHLYYHRGNLDSLVATLLEAMRTAKDDDELVRCRPAGIGATYSPS